MLVLVFLVLFQKQGNQWFLLKRELLPILNKAYSYVFLDGEKLTEVDIPAINLDTGRELKPSATAKEIRTGDNLNEEVVLWKN